MGYEFKCGCRISTGWYLCDKHESRLLDILTSDKDEQLNKVEMKQ